MTGQRHPDHHRELLSELGRLSRETRSATRWESTWRWLIAWGFAWLLSYGGFAVMGPPASMFWCLGVVVVASLISWNPRRGGVRTGWQSRLRVGWIILLVSSPFLVTIVAPLPLERVMLFLGALWSLGMTLYAVATDDPPTAVVTGSSIVVAALAVSQQWVYPLSLFAVAGGGPLLILGLWRWRCSRRARGNSHG